MGDNYDYRRFDLPRGGYGASKQAVQRLLQPIGDDAWEITYISAGPGRFFSPAGDPGRWVDARRPPYGTPAPSSWEYTGFNTHAMPDPAWSEHLASRGWQRVPEVWYSYMADVWYVFKRTSDWRGTDDGEICTLLESRGLNTRDVMRLGRRGWKKPLNQVVSEILETKWQLSVEAGHDVGTQRAVENWWANQQHS